MDSSTNSPNYVEMASTVSLTTFDQTIYAQIPMSEEAVLAEDFLMTVGKSIGLANSSIKYFGIFQGLLHPTQKFKSIDQVQRDAKGLTFQKWCFDLKQEVKLLADPVAVLLIYAQCKAYVDNGLWTLNEEQRAKLEENDDQSKATDYIKVCHTLPGYNTVKLWDCVLHESFGLLPAVAMGTGLRVRLRRRGVVLSAICQDDCAKDGQEYFISWRKIERWRRDETDQRLMTFDVYSVPSEESRCLCIRTDQAQYLLAATIEMIKGLQSELKGPVFQTSDLIRNKRREVVEWRNTVFSASRFNAEREIAEEFAEVSMLR